MCGREREREIGEENEERERVVVSIQTIKKVKERTSRQILKITILVSFGLFFSSNPSRTLQIEIIQSKILTSSQKNAFFWEVPFSRCKRASRAGVTLTTYTRAP